MELKEQRLMAGLHVMQNVQTEVELLWIESAEVVSGKIMGLE